MNPITFEAHTSYVLGLRFTRDSQTLISSSMDRTVKLWSAPGWDLNKTLLAHHNSVNSIALTPDERVLATGSTDATVRLWSFPTGDLLHTLQDRKQVVAAVAISAEGRWVAAGSYGGRAQIWTTTGEEVIGIRTGLRNCTAVAFSPDSTLLATAGLGDDVRVWSLPSGQLAATLSGHQTAVMAATFLAGDQRLVSLGYEQTIRVWDTATWQEVRAIPLGITTARGLTISADGETAALSLEGRVRLWRTVDWTLQKELTVGAKAVNGIAFSPDGRWLAVGAADRKIRVWDLGA